MKSLTPHLQVLITKDLTLATCWMFNRVDGVSVGVTNHVDDITEGGNTYSSSAGFTRTDIEQNLGLAVDNHDIVGFFDSPVFTKQDLAAKRYDNAEVETFMVDYENPDMGRIWVSVGTLGLSTIRDSTYTIEFRSLLQLLSTPLGEFYGPYCRHKLGGPLVNPKTGRPGCGVDLAPFIVTGTVQVLVNAKRSFIDVTRTESDDWFTGGDITFTSGANMNVVDVIKSSVADGTINLVERLPFDLQVGDTYSVHAGCNHLFRMPGDPDMGPYTGDCLVKFANGNRFGGEPESLSAALQFGGLT